MDYTAARQNMVDCQLATNQIDEPKILQAMSSIPREKFLPEDQRHLAYLDEDIKMAEGRYLMEPMILGRLIQALEPKGGDVALDIGGGTGYSSALLSFLTQTVMAVESNKDALEYAKRIWLELDLCNIVDLQGDLKQAGAKHAPYDMILVNGSVASIPQELIAQLKINTGRLVCVLRPNLESQGKAVLIYRTGENEYSSSPLFDAAVPYIDEFKPTSDFIF